jgi:pantoate--beta-alanine ligase
METDVQLLEECLSSFKNRELVVFAPRGSLFGPNHLCWVEAPSLNEQGEGASRPHFFRGVATVVLKLFNIVRPHNAYFGQKDGQQSILVRALARDLDLSVNVVICPTTRDPVDNLALSTRNQYLTETQRQLAPALYEALTAVVKEVDTVTSAEELRNLFSAKIASLTQNAMKVDYLSIASNETGQELALREGDDDVLLSAAVSFENGIRLLDNIVTLKNKKTN